MSAKWVFIINPTAGNCFAKGYADTVKKMIRLYKVDAEIVFTEQKGHASELAKEFFEKGFTYFIAVGGDGTFNEMARTLVHNKNVVAGIIPAGTGNDFIQILGFPNRFTDEDWKIFFEKNEKKMDTGFCNEAVFFNGMGLGFDAQVAAENYNIESGVKKGGSDKYIWHILKTLLFFEEKKAVIEYNNKKEETDCFINTVSIGRRFAGDFFLTPKAIADDGLLDVCMIKKLSLSQRLKILLQVPKGNHINDKKVHYYQTDKLSLEFKEIVPFHVDGELFFDSKFNVHLSPASLRVIYNPQGNHFFRQSI